MNDQPLVTIAIPTYNRAESYLPQALQSALNQTYCNLEVVVSDNCSTDHTQALIRGIHDPRLRYFRHDPAIRPNDNFNFCFQQAKGSYLLLLHDDDMIDADFVESCIEAAQSFPTAGIIRTGTRLIDFQGKVLHEMQNRASGLTTAAFFRGWFLGNSAIYVCSTLFNVQKLRETGGFQSKHHCYQDSMAVVRLTAAAGRVDVPEVKASFRLHPGEMGAARKINAWCEDSLELLQLMCELASEDQRQIRKDGERFFANANYHRAAMASSPRSRLIAMMKVMRYFSYRQLPPLHLVIHILHGTRLYDALRFIKKRAIPTKSVEQRA